MNNSTHYRSNSGV